MYSASQEKQPEAEEQGINKRFPYQRSKNSNGGETSYGFARAFHTKPVVKVYNSFSRIRRTVAVTVSQTCNKLIEDHASSIALVTVYDSAILDKSSH